MMLQGATRGMRTASRQSWGSRAAPRCSVAAPMKLASPSFSAVPREIPEDIEKVLFTEEQVKRRVRELAREIVRDYQGKELIVVGVLKGAYIFMSDLTRAIAEEGIPSVRIEFVKAASYGARSVSTGSVDVDLCGATSWEGRHVLLVEDIIDSGNTLSRLAAEVAACDAAGVRVVALLDKRARRQVPFHADYVGFEIPDAFIVGYGLDYDEMYRCLPYVAVLRREVYTK
ncbi:MAG: hypoxanthine phosphoribosyltransferase [Monoraphidium minutum]|nr:MAG: hypoxanthine phosphoribosyltransferase [Monoraphidium minutum]